MDHHPTGDPLTGHGHSLLADRRRVEEATFPDRRTGEPAIDAPPKLNEAAPALRPAMLSSGPHSIRLLGRDDRGLLGDLYAHGPNTLLVEPLAIPDDRFFDWLYALLWSLPMVLECDGRPVGVAFTIDPNVQSLNSRLVTLCVDPEACAPVVALYVRHLFWSFPLHRLYAYRPDLADLAAYGGLLRACGFIQEGLLRQHRASGGTGTDVFLYGLVRPEFDAWCDGHRPEWSLRPPAPADET
jgi:hypothetical protein